ncbi:MAG: hypothetical protein ACI959_000470, partial [Limisphaerales bacterium]
MYRIVKSEREALSQISKMWARNLAFAFVLFAICQVLYYGQVYIVGWPVIWDYFISIIMA